MKLGKIKNMIALWALCSFSWVESNEVYPGVSVAATLRGLWLPPCKHAVGYTYENSLYESDHCHLEHVLGSDIKLMEEIQYLEDLSDQEEAILALAFESFKTFDVIINENADDIFLTDLEDEMISKAFNKSYPHFGSKAKFLLTAELIKEITEELLFRDLGRKSVDPKEFDVKEDPKDHLHVNDVQGSMFPFKDWPSMLAGPKKKKKIGTEKLIYVHSESFSEGLDPFHLNVTQ